MRTVRARTLLLSMILLGGAQQAVAQSATTPDRFAGVTFPSSVGAFSAVRADKYADASLGIAVRYTAPGTRAVVTLYVYPQRATLDAEFELAVASITEYAAQSGGRITATIDSTDTVAVGGLTGRYALARTTADGNVERSLLYLFERDGHWVKLRISMDPALRVTLDAPLRSLLERMVLEVDPPAAP